MTRLAQPRARLRRASARRLGCHPADPDAGRTGRPDHPVLAEQHDRGRTVERARDPEHARRRRHHAVLEDLEELVPIDSGVSPRAAPPIARRFYERVQSASAGSTVARERRTRGVRLNGREGNIAEAVPAHAAPARHPDGVHPADARLPADAGRSRRSDLRVPRGAGCPRRRSSGSRRSSATTGRSTCSTLEYLGDVVRGDFGTAITDSRPIGDIIRENGAATLELTFFAMIVAIVVGVTFGLLAGRYRDTWIDGGSRLFGILIYAMPVFFLGLMAQLFFGSYLGWLPTSGSREPARRTRRSTRTRTSTRSTRSSTATGTPSSTSSST